MPLKEGKKEGMMLYKYVVPDRTDVITNLELRFTQPGALNDPFELRPQFQSLISEAQFLAGLAKAPLDLAPRLREAYDMLPAAQRAQIPFEAAAATISTFLSTQEMRAVVSGTAVNLLREMAPELTQRFQEQLHAALNANVGILSLSEVPDEELMWGHYADRHHGMVLGFNEAHPFFNRQRSENDDFYHLRRVVYSDLPPAPCAADVDPDATLVNKGTKWAYEREWRMLAPLKDASRQLETADGDVVYLYAFPSEALTKVILGTKATCGLEEKIRSALSGPSLQHVRLSRARLDIERHRVVVD